MRREFKFSRLQTDNLLERDMKLAMLSDKDYQINNMEKFALLRRHSWKLFLTFAFFYLAVYWFLPGENAHRVGYAAFSFLAMMVMGLGIRMNRPVPLLPWRLVLTGMAMIVASDGMWKYYEVVLGREASNPSIIDVIYLCGYVCVGAGLALLIRTRTGGRDRGSLIDAVMVSVGAGVVALTYLIEPSMHDQSMPPLARLVWVFYPLVDVLYLALLARLLFTAGEHARSFYFIGGASCSGFSRTPPTC